VSEAAEAPTYAFRPRMLGSDSAFRLTPDSLEWSIAGQVGRVAYPMITHVRLGYRPTNLGGKRFTTEIWSRNTPRIEIASISTRSLVASEDHGPAYTSFVRELHSRIAKSGGSCRFEAGFAAWRWWPMAAVGAVTLVGLGYVIVRAVAGGDFQTGAFILAMLALLGWQMFPMILRNRPRSYDPRDIPADVMPD
jgi:hypothetical protein